LAGRDVDGLQEGRVGLSGVYRHWLNGGERSSGCHY
jgi:hypothetical protein